MESVQKRLIEILSPTINKYGFAVAGGWALKLHGITNRPTEDIDFFTDSHSQFKEELLNDLISLLSENQFTAEISYQSSSFMRMIVRNNNLQEFKIEFASDYRELPTESVGTIPVISKKDSAVNKVLTLWGRSKLRDFTDVYDWIKSGSFTPNQLLKYAKNYDNGFTTESFRQTLGDLNLFVDKDWESLGFPKSKQLQVISFYRRWEKSLVYSETDLPHINQPSINPQGPTL